MFLALTFYTLGVWGERRRGVLIPKDVVLFWIGFVFDTLGTTIMSQIAGKTPFSQWNLHSATGAVALILMAVHAIWATYVIMQKDHGMLSNFHRFSLFVWLLWLIPFISGMVLNMN
jgi:uncharacterized repeat protein (TIGR03987 family)